MPTKGELFGSIAFTLATSKVAFGLTCCVNAILPQSRRTPGKKTVARPHIQNGIEISCFRSLSRIACIADISSASLVLTGPKIIVIAAWRREWREQKRAWWNDWPLRRLPPARWTLKIEYDEGYEEVYACPGDVGMSIGFRIPVPARKRNRYVLNCTRWASDAGGLKSAAAPMSCVAEPTTVLARMRLK